MASDSENRHARAVVKKLTSYTDPITTRPGLPAHLVRELSETFKIIDVNGDGKISKEDLGIVARSLGDTVEDADLEKLVAEVDADGDGSINLQEFIDLNTRAVDGESNHVDKFGEDTESAEDASGNNYFGNFGVDRESLLSAFNVFDANGDGFISADELHRVLVGIGDKKVSLEDCCAMIECVDEDGDQKVNFKEFQSLMMGSCQDSET